MYSKKVLKHFRNPKNVGVIRNASGIGKVGNLRCLPPNSMIHSNDYFKKITEINKQDCVVGHNGKYNKVNKIFKRKYTGVILKFKNRLGTTYLTPEHEILALKYPKVYPYTHIKNRLGLKAGWYHAEELEKNDMVLYPILKEIREVKYLEVDTTKKKFDYRSRNIPNKIKIDEDFLRLCGYYLAEGYLDERVTKIHLALSFNINEEEYVEDVTKIVKNIFNLNVTKTYNKSGNALTARICNVFVVRLFSKLFGSGAKNKKIPHFMMLLNPELQKSLLIGLWRGDGFVNKKIPRAGCSTISYQLAQQIKTLLIRQKIVHSLYIEKERKDKWANHKKAYRIHVGQSGTKKLAKWLNIKLESNKKEVNWYWYDKNFIYIPITDISKENYNGYVYNLSIDGSNSYVSESLTVHNCGDVLELYIKVKDNKIVASSFKTLGCVAAISASDVLCDIIKGKTIEEAEKITKDDLINELGGLPPIKIHCSVLGVDSLKEAIKDYKRKNL